MPKNIDLDIIKKPGTKIDYGAGGTKLGENNLIELMHCVDDPLYFISNFMKIQHPTQGALPFIPYEYQKRMINGMHQNRFSVLLTARQMGKSNTFNSIINKDGNKVKIGKLLKYSLREWIVNKLENILIFINKM
jgi:hypothetical protein